MANQFLFLIIGLITLAVLYLGFKVYILSTEIQDMRKSTDNVNRAILSTVIELEKKISQPYYTQQTQQTQQLSPSTEIKPEELRENNEIKEIKLNKIDVSDDEEDDEEDCEEEDDETCTETDDDEYTEEGDYEANMYSEENGSTIEYEDIDDKIDNDLKEIYESETNDTDENDNMQIHEIKETDMTENNDEPIEIEPEHTKTIELNNEPMLNDDHEFTNVVELGHELEHDISLKSQSETDNGEYHKMPLPKLRHLAVTNKLVSATDASKMKKNELLKLFK